MAVVGLIYPGLKAGIDFAGGTELVVELAQPVDLEQARQALLPTLGPTPRSSSTATPARSSSAPALRATSSDQREDHDGARGRLPGVEPGHRRQLLDQPALCRRPLPRRDLLGHRRPDRDPALRPRALRLALRRRGRPHARPRRHRDSRPVRDPQRVHAAHVHDHADHHRGPADDRRLLGQRHGHLYDRIRETLGLYRTEAFSTVANRAINATLSRTIITSGTTLIPLVVLLFLGGEELRGFALALFIGIVLGTYSSIFVSAPLVVLLPRALPHPDPRGPRRPVTHRSVGDGGEAGPQSAHLPSPTVPRPTPPP